MTQRTGEPDEGRRRVILGAAGLTATLAGCSSTGGDTQKTETTSGSGQTTAASGTGESTTDGSVTPSVTVNDQTTDGSYVDIAEAAIDKPGWVAVHPSTSGGGMDADTHVGHAKLPAGRHTDVRIELHPVRDRNTTLYVVLHYDDPADDELTYPDGDPAVTVGGDPVRTSFTLTVES